MEGTVGSERVESLKDFAADFRKRPQTLWALSLPTDIQAQILEHRDVGSRTTARWLQ